MEKVNPNRLALLHYGGTDTLKCSPNTKHELLKKTNDLIHCWVVLYKRNFQVPSLYTHTGEKKIELKQKQERSRKYQARNKLVWVLKIRQRQTAFSQEPCRGYSGANGFGTASLEANAKSHLKGSIHNLGPLFSHRFSLVTH